MAEQEISPRDPYEEDQISLFEILRALLKRKRIIIATAIVVTIASVAFNLSKPNLYTASATLMPVEKNQGSSLSALLGSMGGGLGMLAAQAGMGGGGAADKFVTLLQTRSMAETIISKYKLMPVLFKDSWDVEEQRWKEPSLKFGAERKVGAGPTMEEGVKALRLATSIKADKKSGVVTISVTTWDPEISAKVANVFVDELDAYLKSNALSTAKRNRLFIEDQLKKAQAEMADNELAMKDFQQKNRVVALDAQAEASVKAYSDFKARVIAAEVELRILENASIEGDPRTALKRQEIAELNKQLAEIEGGKETGPILSFQKAPSLGLSYARLQRELLVRGKVLELLTQQYEMAKIQEAQEDISFQLLDQAIAPEKKSAPKRTLNVLMALLGSLLLGALLALVIEFWAVHGGTLRRLLKD